MLLIREPFFYAERKGLPWPLMEFLVGDVHSNMDTLVAADGVGDERPVTLAAPWMGR
jgi:hypothetical protein